MNEINYPDTLRKAVALIELDKAAQAVLDIERPGEKVAEILINSDSAKSLKELLTPATPPAPKPKKIVYTVMTASGNGGIYKSLNIYPNSFDNIVDAVDGLNRAKGDSTYLYFIEKAEVDA